MLAGSLEMPSATGHGAVSVTGHCGITIQPVATSMQVHGLLHWAGWKSLRMLEVDDWWWMMDDYGFTLYKPFLSKFEAKKLVDGENSAIDSSFSQKFLLMSQIQAETNGFPAWESLTIAFDNLRSFSSFSFVVQDRSGNLVVEWLVCCSLMLFVAIPISL